MPKTKKDIKLGVINNPLSGTDIVVDFLKQKGVNFKIINNINEINKAKKEGIRILFVDSPYIIAKESWKIDKEMMNRMKQLSDFVIINNVVDIHDKLNKFYNDLKKHFGILRIERPSWDEYFMTITYLVRERATCLRRKVGAIAVKDKRILATGYNGAPMGMKHCDELGGCLRDKLNIPSGERIEISRAVHAEQNVVAQAARFGIPLDGATIYVTNFPCVTCSKILIDAGIKEIVFAEDYNDWLSKEMLKDSKIKVRQFKLKKIPRFF